jgi:hypothetical protein
MATAKTETNIAPEDRMTYVTLPLLDEEKPGTVDQTEVVQCEGKNNNHPLIIQRGQRVEIPIWAFEALVHSGRYTVASRRGETDSHTEYHTNL